MHRSARSRPQEEWVSLPHRRFAGRSSVARQRAARPVPPPCWSSSRWGLVAGRAGGTRVSAFVSPHVLGGPPCRCHRLRPAARTRTGRGQASQQLAWTLAPPVHLSEAGHLEDPEEVRLRSTVFLGASPDGVLRETDFTPKSRVGRDLDFLRLWRRRGRLLGGRIILRGSLGFLVGHSRSLCDRRLCSEPRHGGRRVGDTMRVPRRTAG